MFELKKLSPAAVPAALAKAERYRLLNEPQQSESICEDILRTDPDNQQALIMLILALSDGFPHDHARTAARAQALIAKLPAEYDRHYYSGLIAERRGRALLDHPGPGTRAAASWLREAMDAYTRAEALGPAGNDEARLRWNACARTFNAHPELLVEDDAPSAPVMSE